MSVNFRDQKTIYVLFALVVLLAVPTLMSWLTPVATMSELRLAERETGGRGPASLSTEASIETPSKTGRLSRPVLLEWHASGKEISKDVFGTHLRLKGHLKGMKAAAIVNETNGFTASLFTDGAEYSTDFIELREGQNKIKVELTDSKGRAVTKRIEVVRRRPASQP